MTDTPRPLEFTLRPNAQPMPESERLAAFEQLGFGTLFSDHMAVIRWSADKGWHSAEITARAPFMIDPAAAVLHYAQEIFEGMKAYRHADGKIALFRPEENARRFNKSASRLAMPEIAEADFIGAVEKLIAQDAEWVPTAEGASLYLRPFMFATEAYLGVRPAREYVFCVIASPVGPYFKGGAKPVTIWASQNYTRAARGGTGEAKCGGNYAASLAAQNEASANGCEQVVFLDASQQRWIEELGGMNIFFVFDDKKIVTPALGTILDGITRKSLIALAEEAGYEVTERAFSFVEWQEAVANGTLREAFACGTAAVVAPIGKVKFAEGEMVMGNGEGGPVTAMLREKLINIQRGLEADTHNWIRVVA